ncbi:MAG: serine hydrolase [Acidobacteria bacterium]|nr:serine hydrolase [Acidobacteriota bacterium]MBI3427306.1 serine hydrolase [Acidobacteriota bacterium]
MKRTWALLRATALVLYALIPVYGQTAAPVKPEAVGLSSERLERINQLFARKIKEGKLVGALTLVARRGKLVHLAAAGQADAEAGRPLKSDAIFRIYSMTKPITTVAAMLLYEEGKFQLDDPLLMYLPEFKDVQVYGENGALVKPKRPIAVRDLMSHTSGLTYGLFGDTPVDRQYRAANLLSGDLTLAEFTKKLSALPLLFHPGEQWNYGVSTDVLGRLVEVLSGSTLDEFMRQRIFKPLGMSDTAFDVPAAKLDRFTVNYQWGLSPFALADADGKRVIADQPGKSRYARPATFYSGGGGLVSTAHDYLRFCQMLLNGGTLEGVRLLSPKTVQLMTMDHTAHARKPTAGVTIGEGTGFGLGFRVVTDAADHQRIGSLGTFDWAGAASTSFFIDPKEQLIGIMMTQKMPTDLRLMAEFRTAVYQAIVESNGH